MSSSGSDSGSELDYEEEMALRIALERSKVETGGSSGSRASPQLPRWRSSDAGAGPSRPMLRDARTAKSAPAAPHRLLPPPAAPPRGQRWVLVPAPPARTRTPELEARAARGSVHGRGTRRSSPHAAAAGRRRTPTRTHVSSHGSTAAPSRRQRRTLAASDGRTPRRSGLLLSSRSARRRRQRRRRLGSPG